MRTKRLGWLVVAAAFLVAGCGVAGRQAIVRSDKLESTAAQHPLSKKVLGEHPMLNRLGCALKTTVGPYGHDCAEIIPAPGFALSLSGGGYRASVFHYGAIQRLNESGRLKDLRMVCAVSGGAIPAAILVDRWNQLKFDEQGIAENLPAVVGEPLFEVVSKTLDAKPVLTNILSFGHAGASIVPSLERSSAFKGRHLSDLPIESNSPLLVILATDVQSGRQVAISRDFVGADVPTLSRHSMTLAQAVAASSSFPPVLGPIRFRLEQHPKFGGGAQNNLEPETEELSELVLMDGGVIDNLALNLCDYAQTHYVSDAGNPLEQRYSAENWISATGRVIDLIHYHGSALAYQRVCGEGLSSLCWRLADRHFSPKLGVTGNITESVRAAAQQPTRLKGLTIEDRCALLNAGYLAAWSAMQYRQEAHIPGTFPCPNQLPPAVETLWVD